MNVVADAMKFPKGFVRCVGLLHEQGYTDLEIARPFDLTKQTVWIVVQLWKGRNETCATCGKKGTVFATGRCPAHAATQRARTDAIYRATVQKPAYSYRRQDPEKARAWNRAYYQKNRKRILAKQKAAYHAKTSKGASMRRRHAREYSASYYIRNRDRILAYQRDYQARKRAKAKAAKKAKAA